MITLLKAHDRPKQNPWQQIKVVCGTGYDGLAIMSETFSGLSTGLDLRAP